MRTFVFASTIAAALAVKQNPEAQSNADLEMLARDHDITVVDAKDYSSDDIEGTKAQIENWFATQV